jgi:HPt (histidine-containing phosphotransfer) domain-containing protein
MGSISQAVASLEARRDALVTELASVDAQLHAVTSALAAGKSSADLRAAHTIRSVARRRARKTARRSWFARNEAAHLLRKVAKAPKKPADLVRALAEVKGFEETLSARELQRFQGAAFMAINHAIKAKILRRQPSGMLVTTG